MEKQNLRDIPVTQLAGKLGEMGNEREAGLLASATLNKFLDVEKLRDEGFEVYLPGETKAPQTNQKQDQAKGLMQDIQGSIGKAPDLGHNTSKPAISTLKTTPEMQNSAEKNNDPDEIDVMVDPIEELRKEINSEKSIKRIIEGNTLPDIYIQRLLTLDNLCKIYGVTKKHVEEALDSWLFNEPVSYEASYETPRGARVTYSYSILSQEEMATDKDTDSLIDTTFYDYDLEQRRTLTRFVKCIKQITLYKDQHIYKLITGNKEIANYLVKMIPEYRIRVLKDFSKRLLFYTILSECEEAFKSF